MKLKKVEDKLVQEIMRLVLEAIANIQRHIPKEGKQLMTRDFWN